MTLAELGESLDLIDTERAGKISGSRFGYLKNDGVMLEMAMLDFGFKKLKFIPIKILYLPIWLFYAKV